MNLLLKISALVLITIASSCDATKNASKSDPQTQETEEKTAQDMSKKYQSEGYNLGTVVFMKDSDCTYVIKDDKTGTMYDPINIDDSAYKTFKTNNAKVYYKFIGLRMMNRCEGIQPIQLNALEKR